MQDTLDLSFLKRAIEQLANSLRYYHSEIVRSDKGLLLSNLVAWKRYRQKRGTTSHTYDPAKAIEIFTESITTTRSIAC